jgi:hypothetical protein
MEGNVRDVRVLHRGETLDAFGEAVHHLLKFLEIDGPTAVFVHLTDQFDP